MDGFSCRLTLFSTIDYDKTMLRKDRKTLMFLEFFPDALHIANRHKKYPCIMCGENMINLADRTSWEQVHFIAREACPANDDAYVGPGCNPCNKKCGMRKQNQISAFDMMFRYGYKHNIIPILEVKMLHYNVKDCDTLLLFCVELYGRSRINRNGFSDLHCAIQDLRIYKLVFDYEWNIAKRLKRVDDDISRLRKKRRRLEKHLQSDNMKEFQQAGQWLMDDLGL